MTWLEIIILYPIVVILTIYLGKQIIKLFLQYIDLIKKNAFALQAGDSNSVILLIKKEKNIKQDSIK